MADESRTGSIVWNWRDPKTVELYNTEQAPAPSVDSLESQGPDPRELALQQQMMVAEARLPGRRDFSPAEKRDHKKQIRTFLKNWKKSDPTEFDPLTGIQEMIDSGAMSYDEDGLWTMLPHMNRKDTNAIVGAADEWADRVGIWRGKDFDPGAYRPYGSEQQRMWEERSARVKEMIDMAERYPDLSDEERAADRARRQNATTYP